MEMARQSMNQLCGHADLGASSPRRRMKVVFALGVLGVLGASAFAGGCEPTTEKTVAQGGRAPDPRASIEGTLSYIGPPPACDANNEVKGRALLNLFSTTEPAPPTGSGLPASMLLIHGEELFNRPADCRMGEDDGRTLTRSVSFVWPGIHLEGTDATTPASYRIVGVWDDDANLNPLYGVRQSATRGDLLGGAFTGSLEAATPTIISVGPSASFPNGQRVRGITVTLALPVTTEPPIAELNEDRKALSSLATFPLAADLAGVAGGLLAMTRTRLLLPDLSASPYSSALEKAGLDWVSNPVTRAFYFRAVDMDGDGTPDLHPVLGPIFGVPWVQPVVLLQRAKTLSERAAGVPDVFFVAHPVVPAGVASAFSVDLAIPPIAIVRLSTTDPSCLIPYAAPGNIAQTYEAGPVVCAELPSGRYDVYVSHGLAGAMPVSVSSTVSPTGFLLSGGQVSGQFWRVPNELGAPDLAYNPYAVPQLVTRDEANAADAGSSTVLAIDGQGDAGRFVVAGDLATPAEEEASASPACEQAFDPFAASVREVQSTPVPTSCCESVRHLCGLPLCAWFDLGNDLGGDRRIQSLDANGVPDCVPFEMPASCCTQ